MDVPMSSFERSDADNHPRPDRGVEIETGEIGCWASEMKPGDNVIVV